MKRLAQGHTARKEAGTGSIYTQGSQLRSPWLQPLCATLYSSPGSALQLFLFSRIILGLETMRTVGLYIWGPPVHPVGAWPPRVGTTPVTKVRSLGGGGEMWESV